MRLSAYCLSVSLCIVVLAACESTGGSGSGMDSGMGINAGESPEIGIIEFFGESEDVLNAPSSASKGVPFVVAVSTYGNSCYEADSVNVELVDTGVTLTPYDRNIADGIDGCPSNLGRIPREVEVTFAGAGTMEITVKGRRVDANGDELTSVSTSIVVE